MVLDAAIKRFNGADSGPDLSLADSQVGPRPTSSRPSPPHGGEPVLQQGAPGPQPHHEECPEICQKEPPMASVESLKTSDLVNYDILRSM